MSESSDLVNPGRDYNQPRTAAQDFAYNVGRQARIEGLTLKDANVRLAYKRGWVRREQFDDDLLDECERGWYAEDELRS